MSQLPLKNRVDDPSVEAIVLHLLLCTMVICSGTSTSTLRLGRVLQRCPFLDLQ